MLGDLRENKLIMVGRETERKERGERNGVCERRENNKDTNTKRSL